MLRINRSMQSVLKIPKKTFSKTISNLLKDRVDPESDWNYSELKNLYRRELKLCQRLLSQL